MNLKCNLKKIIKTWTNKSDKPFDVAFADCTSYEKYLPKRISEWTDYCLNNGVRNVIICDSRGIGKPDQIEEVFEYLQKFGNRVEFHPHNDNGKALDNVVVALNKGVETIGTSFYNSSERLTMIDPRDLIKYGLFFDYESFDELENQYCQKIGDPNIVSKLVFGEGVVVTGNQYRLRKRDSELITMFGVTSDTYIASLMLGKNVSPLELSRMKDLFLYENKNIVLAENELKYLSENLSDRGVFYNVCCSWA